MHESSMKNMNKMFEKILTDEFIGDSCLILDFGGRKLKGNKSYYSLIEHIPNIIYKGVDIVEGSGVDIVMEDPYICPLDNESTNLIVSGQMLEHCEFFWLTIKEMERILKPGGYILLIAPSKGNVHRYPVDCWRFYPDAYQALAKWANLELIESWEDDGEWGDQCGIMRKSK